MKIFPVFLVFSFGLLLVLPEVTGAPAGDSNKGEVLYSKTSEDKSKYRARRVQEERDVEKEDSVCSNGLYSGKREYSVSQQLNEEELDKSRKEKEVRTANGVEKVEESAKKKTLITANTKKSVIVYYLVSYKKLPAKKPDECRCAYFKRVFPKERDIAVVYHKIFKVYEGEEPQQYIERIEFIFNKVYPELDPRLDVRFVDFFDHYYTQKYFRMVNEKDEHYFARVFKRLDGESFDHYRKRMQCMEASLDEEDFEHITFVDTETGYKVGERKRPVKSVSSPKSSGIKYGNFKNEKKKSRKQARKLNTEESSEQVKDNQGSSVKEQRKLSSSNEVVEKEEEIKMFSYKVAYTRLPKKKVGQCDTKYYKDFFGEYNPNMTTDQRNEFYLRLLIQYKEEEFSDYVQRIDYLFDNVYPELDIRTNPVFVSMMEHYFHEKYLKEEKESEDEWIARIFKKQVNETFEKFKGRVACIETVFMDDCDWSRVVLDANSPTWYTLKPLEAKAEKAPKPCSCSQ